MISMASAPTPIGSKGQDSRQSTPEKVCLATRPEGMMGAIMKDYERTYQKQTGNKRCQEYQVPGSAVAPQNRRSDY
jgi:hypothetical protein